MAGEILPKLPEEVINPLRQMLWMGESHQFAIGDYLVSVVDEFSHILKRSQIIAQLAIECRCDRSTLRDRESLARFVTKEMRQEFEIFTWSQWRSLRTAGEHWRQYAERAALEMWSTDRIRAEIKNDNNNRPSWAYWLDKIYDAAERIIQKDEAPPIILDTCQKILEQLSNVPRDIHQFYA